MSDIFDEYCRIMEEQGHIKPEAPKSVTKQAQQSRVEKEGDSEYQEKIKALYGIDIKLNDSDKNIIEQAHPNMVIVAPSYDRMNGVVENIQERHNVMTGIALNKPKGNLTQHRYAKKKELLDELIRLSFALDNQDEEGLSKEALIVAAQLSKLDEPTKKKVKSATINKKAFIAMVWPVVSNPWFWRGVGIASTWVLAKQNFIGYIDQGVKADCERTIQSLEQFKTQTAFRSYIDKLIAAFESFLNETNQALEILSRSDDSIGQLKTTEDILNAKQKINGTKEEIALVKKYITTCQTVSKSIGSSMGDGLIGRIQAMKTNAESAETDVWQSLKWMYESVAGDSKSHVINSLGSLRDSINQLVSEYDENIREVSEESKEQAKSALDSFKDMFMGSSSEESESENKSPTKSNNISDYVIGS